MRLVTLNIWGGHVRDPLHRFVSSHQNVDIFCFQEVYHNAKEMITREDRKVSLTIFAELQALLPSHNGYFRPVSMASTELVFSSTKISKYWTRVIFLFTIIQIIQAMGRHTHEFCNG